MPIQRTPAQPEHNNLSLAGWLTGVHFDGGQTQCSTNGNFQFCVHGSCWNWSVYRISLPLRPLVLAPCLQMFVRKLVRCAENLFDPANYYIYSFDIIMHTHEAIRFQCGKSVRMCVYTLGSWQVSVNRAHVWSDTSVCAIRRASILFARISCECECVTQCWIDITHRLTDLRFALFSYFDAILSLRTVSAAYATKMKTSCLSFLFSSHVFNSRSHVSV